MATSRESTGRNVSNVPARRDAAVLFLRKLARKRLGIGGAVVVLLLILVAVFAEQIAPYDFNERNVVNRLQPPSAEHWLGTDQIGRDVLSRLIVGSRLSLLVGLSATLLGVVTSLFLGTLSGFIGGKLDMSIQRFVDAAMTIPDLLVLLTMLTIFGRGLLQFILVIGIWGAIGGSRTIRSAVIAIKENVYFESARAVGSPVPRILLRHVVPNLMPLVIIGFTGGIGYNILTVAGLSFLGFGLDVGTPDWGSMLSREGRVFMESAWWLAMWPGLLLTIAIFSFNMFGDALRDLLDPRLRGANVR